MSTATSPVALSISSIVITSSLVTVTPVTVNVKFIALGAAAEAVLFATSAVSGEVLRAFAVTVFSIAPVLKASVFRGYTKCVASVRIVNGI